MPNDTILYEGAMSGVFVHDTVIRELDTCISVLMATVESARQYMTDTDDGSLEWQLLRRALRESFLDLAHTLDFAGLLNEASQYPDAMRAQRRNAPDQRPLPKNHHMLNAATDRAHSTAMLDELVKIGRLLVSNYLLQRELEETDVRRKELDRLSQGRGASNGVVE